MRRLIKYHIRGRIREDVSIHIWEHISDQIRNQIDDQIWTWIYYLVITPIRDYIDEEIS